MVNQQHVELLKKGVKVWNEWRKNNKFLIPDLSSTRLVDIDLSGANLSGTNFTNADLSGANLSNTDLIDAIFNDANLSNVNLNKTNAVRAYLENSNLSNAYLIEANFSLTYLPGANLSRATLNKARFEASSLYYTDFSNANISETDFSSADFWRSNLNNVTFDKSSLLKTGFIEANLRSAYLRGAELRGADLRSADLRETDLRGADLTKTNLSESNLNSANLSYTRLIETDLTAAILNNCRVYGTSVWDIKTRDTKQENLIITPEHDPLITVDNLKVAQFIYILLNNKEIRNIINTITTKVVLILGRFTPKQKKILNMLRDTLRQYDYLPILFDFERPMNHNFTETVSILAHLSHFIISDLTNPGSVPQELQSIVPTLAVPIQPILLDGKKEYSMFKDFSRYHWVLPIHHYKDQAGLLASLHEYVIKPAEQKARELQQR